MLGISIENLLAFDEEDLIDFSIPSASDNLRVDRVISMITGSSRSRVVTEIENCRVFLNGRPVNNRSLKVRQDEKLSFPNSLLLPSEVEPLVPDANVHLDIVYEDAHLIVINKSPGIVVHPGVGVSKGTLSAGLLYSYPELATIGPPERPGIVHRLDRPTSGLLVIARDELAYESLSEQMRLHSATRRYFAIVHGTIDPKSATLEGEIGKARNGIAKMQITSQGKFARTHYDCVGTLETDQKELSVVTVTLDTGRTHQIRVHMSSYGNPVLGDALYGSRMTFDGRIALHAYELSFTHPQFDRQITITIPIAPEIISFIDASECTSGSGAINDFIQGSKDPVIAWD